MTSWLAGTVFLLWLTAFLFHRDFWVTFFSNTVIVQKSFIGWFKWCYLPFGGASLGITDAGVEVLQQTTTMINIVATRLAIVPGIAFNLVQAVFCVLLSNTIVMIILAYERTGPLRTSHAIIMSLSATVCAIVPSSVGFQSYLSQALASDATFVVSSEWSRLFVILILCIILFASGMPGLALSLRRDGRLIAALHGTADDEQPEATELISALQEARHRANRFVGTSKDYEYLEFGSPEDATFGLFEFIAATESTDAVADLKHCTLELIRAKGIEAIREEWSIAQQKGIASSDDLENVRYVLDMKAGSSKTPFQHGWMRDHTTEGDPIPERDGWTLTNFLETPQAKAGKLQAHHVAALRLYTTYAFRTINNALRKKLRKDDSGNTIHPLALEEPYPLPVTLHCIAEALHRLRKRETTDATSDRMSRGDPGALPPADAEVAHAESPSTHLHQGEPSDSGVSQYETHALWRGIKDRHASKLFLLHGGVELAPTSTTNDPVVALQYTQSEDRPEFALLLRILPQDWLSRGAEISFLSAFPHEQEFLYPPLTHLRVLPNRWLTPIEHEGTTYEILECAPTFPSL